MKITCRINYNKANRWAEFRLDGSEQNSVIVSQYGDAITLTMDDPRVYWNYQPVGGATHDLAFGVAEMLRKATELARRWSEDTGKPIKEVLTNEGVTNDDSTIA